MAPGWAGADNSVHGCIAAVETRGSGMGEVRQVKGAWIP